MAESESETWQDERLWNALKYRIQAAHDSRSRVRQRAHLEQALLYLNALNTAVVTDSVPRDLLTAEDAELALSPSDAEQLMELRRVIRDEIHRQCSHCKNGLAWTEDGRAHYGYEHQGITGIVTCLASRQLRSALTPKQEKETQ